MPPSNLRELLSRDEGRRNQPYYDSLGFVTVGVGCLMDPRKPCPVPDQIVDLLLDHHIEAKTAEVLQALPWVATLSPVRQAVVISMAFQLGTDGLLQFKNSLGLLEKGDYTAAAAAFLQSKVARVQAPARWARFAKMIETDQWA